MNRFGELFGAFEAGIVQRLALKDAEPNLHLVEPARAGRREVKGDVRMGCQPVLVFLVGVQVVEDDVVRISAHRGRHFRLIVDAVSAGSWTTGVARK